MITDLKINEARKARYYEQGYWTHQTIGDVWDQRISLSSADTYVQDDRGSTFTYSEVDDQAGRLAAWLVAQGIVPGDVVTFQMPTWAEFAIVYVACLKAGAVMHPLPIDFTTADLIYGMNLVGSKAFLCPTVFEGRDLEAQAMTAANKIPSLVGLAFIDRQGPSPAGNPTLSSITASFEPITTKPAVTSDDAVCILATSGSTGKPKAALFTHNTILFSERSFVKGVNRTQSDVMFMPSPLNHATGFFHGLISPMILGGRTVLQQKFDAEAAVDLVNDEGCTWSMGATPFIFDILNELERTDKKLSTLQVFLCGGAPVPGHMVQWAHKHGVALAEIYGSTESCPHIFVPPHLCFAWDGAWSGIPFEGIEVRVVDEQRNEVPCGVQGEEASRGPHQFVGYLNDPKRTAAALDDDGWFYSGDLCYRDDEGRIRINGRKKEIIIRGGENISAIEVDEHIAGCPGIGDHASIGMPDERLGERVCTFAVPTGDTQPTLEEVSAYLAAKGVRGRLHPERIEYIDA
ncbi:MAG: medium-chain fatty-acid--CoA ligase, partial [Raoultibacter sp.]